VFVCVCVCVYIYTASFLSLNEVKQAYTGVGWGRPRETYHLEDLGVDGRIVLTLILPAWRIW